MSININRTFGKVTQRGEDVKMFKRKIKCRTCVNSIEMTRIMLRRQASYFKIKDWKYFISSLHKMHQDFAKNLYDITGISAIIEGQPK